ncbi:MipA/OmpV family protein [Janthinobacterium fluminis]|uniref:MipA/OmpV family protein n=1 Tax=Janthinobacterium fluminis TaxID=2987524 RepID=A0ABT5K2G3_9BURK|nr:MipA/OmpV family protein [Janthinobacterium fluminis]MDC8758916.1 MipA/OmpV family protein [Janthinobacterium fluminis]
MPRTLTTLFLSLSTLASAGVAAEAPPARLAAAPAAATAPAATFIVGLGLATLPEYAGAKKTRVVPLPIAEAHFGNGIFVGTSRGIGYQRTVGGVNVSAALGYGGARPDHKENAFYGSDAFKGMGKVDGSALLNLSASARLGVFDLSAGTSQSLSRRKNGSTYTFGVSAPLYQTATDKISWSASAEYGDAKHAQTYFGVTAAQSLTSGYRQKTAKAGFETVNTSINWERTLSKSWSLRGTLGVTGLVGDAASSPLTQRKVSPIVITGVAYTF